jgi:DNA-binding HxlR family transcriptional regulator
LIFAPKGTKIEPMAEERAVYRLLDLLGRRWSLRLIWELRRDAVPFSELRRRTGISPSVLASRLAELSSSGIVERERAGRYRLSGRGRELARLLYELNRWAERPRVSSERELA